MATIYADRDRARFFLIPKDAALPEGDLEIATLTGAARRVDGAAAAAFEIPEAEAKAHVQEKMGAVQAVVAEVLGELGRLAAAAQSEDPAGRLAEVLAALGVTMDELRADPAGAARALTRRMMELGLDEVQALTGRPAS